MLRYNNCLSWLIWNPTMRCLLNRSYRNANVFKLYARWQSDSYKSYLRLMSQVSRSCHRQQTIYRTSAQRSPSCSLHNEKIPIPSAIILSEFIQRIPVVAYVVGDAYPAMPSVIFQPASNSRRTLQLTLRIGFE